MKTEKDKIIRSVDNDKALKTSYGKPLNWFTIAGADGKFVAANAVFKKNKIEVSSPELAYPTSIRFAWDEKAQTNFVNEAGLSAVPFRTDGLKWSYRKM